MILTLVSILHDDLIPWGMHLHKMSNAVVIPIEAFSVSFSAALLSWFIYEILIFFYVTYLSFWCIGSQRENSYIWHDNGWRGAICSWFPCKPITVTSFLHLCCYFAWQLHLQWGGAGEKPTDISMQFIENASWGGGRVIYQLSHQRRE